MGLPAPRLLLTLFFLVCGSSFAEANPFAKLTGSWSGKGTLEPLGGDREPVKCRADYAVLGKAITQTIVCVGAVYRINAIGKLTYSEGRLSGSWSETNYGAGGGASGKAKGDLIYLRISSDKFNARMSLKISGAGHTVSIKQFDAGNGKYRSIANISLRR